MKQFHDDSSDQFQQTQATKTVTRRQITKIPSARLLKNRLMNF